MQNLWIEVPVPHEENRHEREPSRLDDETSAEGEGRATHEPHGLRVHENGSRRVFEPEVLKMVGECVTFMLVVALQNPWDSVVSVVPSISSL